MKSGAPHTKEYSQLRQMILETCHNSTVRSNSRSSSPILSSQLARICISGAQNLTWVSRTTVCAPVIPRDVLNQILQSSLVPRLAALAQCRSHCRSCSRKVRLDRIGLTSQSVQATGGRVEIHVEWQKDDMRALHCQLSRSISICWVTYATSSMAVKKRRVSSGEEKESDEIRRALRRLPASR